MHGAGCARTANPRNGSKPMCSPTATRDVSRAQAAASLCANWEIHRGINIVEGRVNAMCNLMGTQPPCGAGSSYPDPSYVDYLWLGDVDSLGECQNEALKQAADPCVSRIPSRRPSRSLGRGPFSEFDSARLLVERSQEGYEPCVSVAYYTATSSEEDFKRQCYCGTTKDWVAQASPSVISARFDGATECWCARLQSRRPFIAADAHWVRVLRVARARRGWPIVIGLLALMIGYLVVGSVYNMQTKQVTGVAALPHPDFWKSGFALVRDGAYYTRGQLRGGEGGADGGGYEKLPAAVAGGKAAAAADAPAGERLQEEQAKLRQGRSGEDRGARGKDSKKKEKSSKKEKRSKSAKKGKDEGASGKSGKSSKSSKSKGSSSSKLSLEDKGRAVTAEAVQGHDTTDGFGGAVREERDEEVHSSMAKVKVVALTGES